MLKLEGDLKISEDLLEALQDVSVKLPPNLMVYALHPLEAALIDYIRGLEHGTIRELEIANSLPMSGQLQNSVVVKKLRFRELAEKFGHYDKDKRK